MLPSSRIILLAVAWVNCAAAICGRRTRTGLHCLSNASLHAMKTYFRNNPMPTRRDFIQSAAALGAAGLGAGDAKAGDAKEAFTGLQRGLVEVVHHRFHTQDLAADMKAIADDVAGNIASAAALARVPLNNGDEPDF